MGKKQGQGNNHQKPTIKYQPFVSICTPTFNRRPFIETMFQCFRNQTYPKNRMEWIIIDDGTDKINDLVASSNIPQIQYFAFGNKMTLGAKRNYMHEKTKGSILVYMDDDDYYPPERVAHAVEMLTKNPKALCAGSSELYVFFKHINKMIQCGPYGPNHSTAGTFAFKRELLSLTKYESNASLAEERAFLKDYTIPFVQLDPLKTILVFSHEHNTFDKRKLLENMTPQYCKESPNKTISDFIRHPYESKIRDFFTKDIDELLLNYAPGKPEMKPDVLVQLAEMDVQRKKMEQDAQAKSGQANQAVPQIMIERPGQPPQSLSPQEVVDCIKQQQNHIKQLLERVSELEGLLVKMQQQMIPTIDDKILQIAPTDLSEIPPL